MKKEVLLADFIEHKNMYRIFRDSAKQDTIAYIESIEEAREEHSEFEYKEVKK